jgi:nicotinate-nucleotide pyrophosphorylase
MRKPAPPLATGVGWSSVGALTYSAAVDLSFEIETD